MSERILHILHELRAYALSKNATVTFLYHEEDSYLMRFANSAISLNTNEHLIRLDITAYDGKKRASCDLLTNLDQLDEMKRGVDTAIEMVQHAQPLSYSPTVPLFSESFYDVSAYDPDLAGISNAEKLDLFNQVSAGLETAEIKLSGIFSCGSNMIAQINTRSEHTQFFQTSDAQISIVLAHSTLKWEVRSEQSAQRKSDLNPAALRAELAFLLDHYQKDPAVQLPLGKYAVVFGSAAIAELVSFMNWIGISGGLMKRGFSFIKEDQVGQKVFSSQIDIIDDPSQRETYPFQRDFTGLKRQAYPLFQQGIFKGFTWSQDDADEFSAAPTGHTVPHKSLVLKGGIAAIRTLEELAAAPRDQDLLYIPYLHYMNIVNPSLGVVTGSSRFGALLLKKDGTIAIPYNVRLTQSLLDIFGEQVRWISADTLAYNTSHSYGARNPAAVIVPAFMLTGDLEISHSNSSY